MTQQDRILEHLKKNGNIQPLQALRKYGVYRLSAVIYDLRDLGYEIETTRVNTTNRFGDKISYAKYFLKNDIFLNEKDI